MHLNAKWLGNRQKNKGNPYPELPLYLIIYRTFASFAPHALKGQKLLAQGIALGYYGRLADCHYTQGDALG